MSSLSVVMPPVDIGETLASLGTGPDRNVRDEGAVAALTHGHRLGRYVVLRTLGVGAMGTVYLCYDPELDRKVALKLLRSGTTTEKRRALLREAQAMAKLAHPNVVSVHDVGEHEGTVFVAMEFVEGRTLKKWFRDGTRSWREVVEKLLLAGRGLKAAHESGLIHRDFKPENVMLSEDGHVRVMDFGLARPRSGASGSSEDLQEISQSLLTEVTSGRIEGTPAYMAPEQAKAAELSPAADQFAFCVSLWEGVCRQRPFAGETYPELYTKTSEGQIRSPPPSVRMPLWLRLTLQRGLHPDAERRWPSMGALLDALERGQRRWRWQLALGVLALAALPVGLLAAERERGAREIQAQVAACEAEGEEIDRIWNETTRQRLRDGVLSTGASFAQHSVDTLVPWLDDYRETWGMGRTEACLHGTVRKDWNTETFDRSMWCLEDRRLQLEATVDQIAGGDSKAARRAVRLASYLDPVETCLEPKLLRGLPVPPEHTRDEVRSIRKMLTRSDGLRHAGHSADALEVAREARVRAEAVQWPPLLASARFIEGRCMLEGGHFAEADRTLTDAYFEAQTVGSAEVAFRAARSLMRVQTSLQHYRQAETWARQAQLLSAEMADPGGLDAAEGHYLMMAVHLGLGEYEAAAAEGEKALTLRTKTLGAEHPLAAAVLRTLGRVHLASDEPVRALELFERSYDVWRDAVGPDHPHVGMLAMHRASALLALGDPDAALPLVQEGLAIHDKALPGDHPTLAENLNELGKVYATLGRLDEAADARARAMAIRSRRSTGDAVEGVADVSHDERCLGDLDHAVQACSASGHSGLIRSQLRHP